MHVKRNIILNIFRPKNSNNSNGILVYLSDLPNLVTCAYGNNLDEKSETQRHQAPWRLVLFQITETSPGFFLKNDHFVSERAWREWDEVVVGCVYVYVYVYVGVGRWEEAIGVQTATSSPAPSAVLTSTPSAHIHAFIKRRPSARSYTFPLIKLNMAYIPIRVERLEREAAGMEREREGERAEGRRWNEDGLRGIEGNRMG